MTTNEVSLSKNDSAKIALARLVEDSNIWMHGITRRGGLQLLTDHCKEVEKNAVSMFQLSVEHGNIAYLHDLMEYKPDIDLSIYGLSPEHLDLLEVFTRREGESSEEHFLRKMKHPNKAVSAIAFADAMANSHYTEAEKKWNNETLGTHWGHEREKYFKRVQVALLRWLTLSVGRDSTAY